MNVNLYLLSSLVESLGAGFLLCFVLLTLGSPIIYAGWKNRERFRNISSIPRELENASVGDQVAISGNVDKSSKRTDSPFQSKNCQLAMWDICRLKRRGTLGTGFVWSQEAIGIRSHQMIIETSDGNVRVDNLSCKKVLGSSEKVKRSLMADSTTKFSSIEIELDDEGFEKKVEPVKEAPVQYSRFTDKLAFERPRRDSYGLIGRVLTKLRTPSDTTRYREAVFQSGDEISVIGKKTRNGLSFESSESMNPLISSKHISKIEQKYRRAYLFQLYFIPVFCVLFSAVMTYGSYA